MAEREPMHKLAIELVVAAWDRRHLGGDAPPIPLLPEDPVGLAALAGYLAGTAACLVEGFADPRSFIDSMRAAAAGKEGGD